MPNPRFDDTDDDDGDWDIDAILKGTTDPGEIPIDIVDQNQDLKHSFDGSVCPKCGNGIIHGFATGTGETSEAEGHINEALQAFMDTLPPWMRDSVKIIAADGPMPGGTGFHPGVNLKNLKAEQWNLFLESVTAHNGNAPLLRALTSAVMTLVDPEKLTKMWEFYMLEHQMMVFSSMSEATYLFFAALEENPVKVQGNLSDDDLQVLRGCHEDLIARQRLLYEEYGELASELNLPVREAFSDPRTLNLYDENPLLQWTALRMLGFRIDHIVTLKEMRDEFRRNRSDDDDGDGPEGDVADG